LTSDRLGFYCGGSSRMLGSAFMGWIGGPFCSVLLRFALVNDRRLTLTLSCRVRV